MDVLTDPTVVFDLAGSLLAAAQNSLVDSTGGVPGHVFVAHGVPPDDCCDHLVVWVDELFPTHDFPFPVTGRREAASDTCHDVRMGVRLQILLIRNCYPTVVDNPQAPFPADASVMSASAVLYEDARRLWCGVVGAYYDNELYDGIEPDGYGSVLWGPMKPRASMAGCAGWIWTITFELPTCC